MPTKKPAAKAPKSNVVTKEVKVASDHLVKTVKKLLGEGNVRRVILKHKGKTIFEVPMTAGVAVGAVAIIAAPVLAAVGAIAALVSEVTIVVEKTK